MIRTLFTIFLFLPVCSFAQNQLGKTKANVKSSLSLFVNENPGKQPVVIETDSTITLRVNSQTKQPVSTVYYFDKAGNCSMEKVIASCDSCRNALLKTILDNKSF